MARIKLTKEEFKAKNELILDPTQPLAIRKQAHEELMAEIMNPDTVFDPTTFDPKKNTLGYEVKKRGRVEPPLRLPTLGLKPKQILQGQMVGMYESKQDLYLLIAWLSNRVTDLEELLANKP